MELKNLVAVASSSDDVILTFKDETDAEHKLTIRPKSVGSVVDALLRLLAHVDPKRGPAFDIVSSATMRGGQGILATARDGLQITLIMDENAATMVAASATEAAQAHGSGLVH